MGIAAFQAIVTTACAAACDGERHGLPSSRLRVRRPAPVQRDQATGRPSDA